MTSNDILLIAAREPVPGQTKTRLGTEIGMHKAAVLYEAFLRDLAARFAAAGREHSFGWAFSPPESDFPRVIANIAGTLATKRASFVPQSGRDWGERQINLMRWGHDLGFRKTLLIASDSPHLGVDTIEAAFDALERADVVIGPVFDGGYYLIGVRGPHDVLTGVPMSTCDAATGIRERARGLGLSVAMLPATFDIDVAADLDHLRRLLFEEPAAAPATYDAMVRLGLWRMPFDDMSIPHETLADALAGSKPVFGGTAIHPHPPTPSPAAAGEGECRRRICCRSHLVVDSVWETAV